MNEDQIERHAEMTMDRLDRLFMDGHISEQVYSERVRKLNEWCERAYSAYRNRGQYISA